MIEFLLGVVVTIAFVATVWILAEMTDPRAWRDELDRASGWMNGEEP